MDDSFDWVTPRLRAIPENAFKELRDHCESMVEIRNEHLKATNASHTLQLKQNDSGGTFDVERSPAQNIYGRNYYVSFTQSLNHSHIQIFDQSANASIAATPYLTKKGNLRFKVNGCSHKLWQVARLALEPLFFERHR